MTSFPEGLFVGSITAAMAESGTVELPTISVDGYECPGVDLSGETAATIADYTTMHEDLVFVTSLCRKIIETRRAALGAQEANDPEVRSFIRAMSEAAVISYGRCFSRGRSAGQSSTRTRMPEDIMDLLTPAMKAAHDHAIWLRNKHVGHNANEWIKVIIRATLNPVELADPKILSVGPLVIRFDLGPESVENLGAVADFLADQLLTRRQLLLFRLRNAMEADGPERLASFYEQAGAALPASWEAPDTPGSH